MFPLNGSMSQRDPMWEALSEIPSSKKKKFSELTPPPDNFLEPETRKCVKVSGNDSFKPLDGSLSGLRELVLQSRSQRSDLYFSRLTSDRLPSSEELQKKILPVFDRFALPDDLSCTQSNHLLSEDPNSAKIHPQSMDKPEDVNHSSKRSHPLSQSSGFGSKKPVMNIEGRSDEQITIDYEEFIGDPDQSMFEEWWKTMDVKKARVGNDCQFRLAQIYFAIFVGRISLITGYQFYKTCLQNRKGSTRFLSNQRAFNESYTHWECSYYLPYEDKNSQYKSRCYVAACGIKLLWTFEALSCGDQFSEQVRKKWIDYFITSSSNLEKLKEYWEEKHKTDILKIAKFQFPNAHKSEIKEKLSAVRGKFEVLPSCPRDHQEKRKYLQEIRIALADVANALSLTSINVMLSSIRLSCKNKKEEA